jgi:hypothetical protein
MCGVRWLGRKRQLFSHGVAAMSFAQSAPIAAVGR